AGVIQDVLTSFEHHTVEAVHDGTEGAYRLKAAHYDVVILDWDLPGIKGVEILKQIRQSGDMTPVLMLTAKATTGDKEQGLDSGADDYLTKPFEIRELTARLRALLRRSSGQSSNVLKVRDIELDPIGFRVSRGGRDVDLVRREFSLLEFLMRHPNQLFSSEALIARVWESESDASPEALRTCLTRLRKKMEGKDDKPLIKTIHGMGYRLEP
ncbi:MAG: response regulator transcription factor, partial [Cyanobacteria bacterium]|nr:response regulator transcription factor [Cyanobacteriota bacterium]